MGYEARHVNFRIVATLNAWIQAVIGGGKKNLDYK